MSILTGISAPQRFSEYSGKTRDTTVLSRCTIPVNQVCVCVHYVRAGVAKEGPWVCLRIRGNVYACTDSLVWTHL